LTTDEELTDVEKTRDTAVATSRDSTQVEHTDVDPTFVDPNDDAPSEPGSGERTFVNTGVSGPPTAMDVEVDLPESLLSSPEPSAPAASPAATGADSEPSEPKERETVRILCANWQQVQVLVDDYRSGHSCITVRARAKLEIDQIITLQIVLPDKIEITIDAQVVGSSPWEPSGKRPYQIDLVGLAGDQLFYLESRCDQALKPGVVSRATQPMPKFGTNPHGTGPQGGGKR
jgi:hypothetical protein